MAVKTKPELLAAIESNFPNNNVKYISPARQRSVLSDMVDSLKSEVNDDLSELIIRVDFSETPLLVSSPLYFSTSMDSGTALCGSVLKGIDMDGDGLVIGIEGDAPNYISVSVAAVSEVFQSSAVSSLSTQPNRRIRLAASVSNITSGLFVVNFKLI